MDDYRRWLEQAVEERRPCRLARPGGDWCAAVLCRLETTGVVVNAPGHGLRGGEEVRLWLDDGGRPMHFEASVLRSGVPVPDRGPHGLLLGFLAPVSVAAEPIARATATPAPAAAPAAVLDILLPSGAPLSLLSSSAQVLDVGPDHVDFQVPRQFLLVFPEDGTVRLRIGPDASTTTEARARVRRAVAGEAWLVYGLELVAVERVDVLHQALPALRRAIGE